MAKSQGHRDRPKPGAVTEPVRPPARGQQPAPQAKGEEMVRVRVKSGMMGYHDDKRRREGDVFDVPTRLFSQRWMEVVDAATPERITTGQQELRRKHDETLAAAAASGQGATAGLQPKDDDENPLGG